ncbi:hypothetical protein NJB1604_02100 [Mycobacterium marinum]|nr:hypothetical protein NJB1604_02100 [Mycobacterium marinum]
MNVEVGYGWLRERVAKGMKDLQPIKPAPGSVAETEDAYLKPICRRFEDCIKPTLHSALDHLELVQETLHNRPTPHPYAESTLIRTAITAASTALWILATDDTNERRRRALEFTFRDYDGYLSYVKRVKEDGLADQDGRQAAKVDWIIAGLPDDRLKWIVQRASELSPQSGPITVEDFRRHPRKTSDTQIVIAAARALDPRAPGRFDVTAHLVSTWKYLSGFAHGMPWSAVGSWKVLSQDDETGTLTVSVEANPDRLLDSAFMALIVAEKAIVCWRNLCLPRLVDS